MSPLTFDPAAKCPNFEAFMLRIMNNDTDMVQFLQRSIGYSITGSVREEVMFILYGPGGNGKTTLMQLLCDLFGPEYAAAADMSLLTRKKFGESNLSPEVAILSVKRLIYMSEPDQKERLNEAKLKKLVSNEDISARQLYTAPASYRPTHKLWLSTNHKPAISDSGDGLWRRLLLVHFDVEIPPEEQNKDFRLILIAEASGVLNWVLAGLRQYNLQSINPPAKVLKALKEWRGDTDPLLRFIGENCELGPNYMAPSSLLYKGYKAWADDNKERIVSSKDFKESMVLAGYRHQIRNNGSFYHGLRLTGESL
jgi:putative DNA primase/helicase